MDTALELEGERKTYCGIASFLGPDLREDITPTQALFLRALLVCVNTLLNRPRT